MYESETRTIDPIWPGELEMMHFCSPPAQDENDLDHKLLASCEPFDIPFEGHVLKGYRWGSGKKVMLVHGWGSRASHMAFLARHLAKSGFEVLAFDGPAHGRSQGNGEKRRSSLIEFCRAIYHLDKRFGPFYGIAGHSFGAAAAGFTAAGQANLSGYQINPAKLVIISSPPGIPSMVKYYCQGKGYRVGAEKILTQLLEEEFPLTASDYQLKSALGSIGADILIVHDRDDREIPLNDAREMIEGYDHIKMVITSGEGHRRILTSRTLLRAVKDFLQSDTIVSP